MPRKKDAVVREIKGGRGSAQSALPPNGLAHETIARRAYVLFEQRGCAGGHDQEDWYEAERQLLLEARQAAG